MLDFQPLSPERKAELDPFYYAYGGDSCQHSFVSSFCMKGKYGDQVCVRDGFLYTLRALRGSDTERVYLFPLGDNRDRLGAARAIENILADAAAHGKQARFETITEESAALLEQLMPGRFHLEEKREYAEYLYSHDRLAMLPGHDMASKRHDISTFERTYAGRYDVKVISSSEDTERIRPFQQKWLDEKMMREEDVQLELENEAIRTGLDCFFSLGLSGIYVLLDGEIAGYAYGAKLSDQCYDVMIEKGDHRYQDIYKILNRDLVRLCCDHFSWINREEDLGVEGLRKAKMSYKPDRLIRKYIGREADKA